jgi:tRNA-(ms[2]io[6]A)-hydroxylase
VLPLASQTGGEWVERVLPHRDTLLLEQAHLERKAASAALTFMFTYQEFAAIQRPLAELARDELEHYELVLDHLGRRGVPFARLVPCGYATRLHRVIRAHEPERGLDALLVSAMIEARSCERMRLLAQALASGAPDLAGMYRALTASEARHHAVYVDLARACYPDADVSGRLAAVAAFEAEALAAGPREPRLHG